jgi:hypothetical protein
MLYVRAWSNDIHGAWSDPVALPQPDEVQPDAYSSLPDKQTPQNEPSLISIGTAGITETTSRFRSSILYLIPILAIMLIGVVFLVGISFRGAAGTLDSTIPTEEILEKVGPDHRQPLFSPETITPSVTVAPSITVAPIITETATAQPPVIPTPTSTGVPIITETATAQPPVIPTPTSTGVPTNTQREQGSVINQ